ncbi:capsule biosynthesis protein [Achromobacter pestifer]|uniref:capsule biosynthesis protein n=1 Tax=Achromobacter pestifer TaxID=1353889 RepID=UPI001FEBA5C0|nr:capsular biosynthesis protein [Achromobacter pestifer]
MGDRVYWNNGEAVSYRGPMAQLSEFYFCQFRDHGITDVVLFGDCRPVHRPAIEQAKLHKIRVHVFEEGYFRPYWITLERDGVNANSRLSRDPDWYRTEARNIPHYDNGIAFSSPFWKRAAYDVGYNFWAGLNAILHHGVESHVPYSPLTEYIGYLRRGVRVKWQDRNSRQIETKLIAESETNPFYLLPLQLANDAQIVHHSPYRNMSDVMIQVINSFSMFAPKNSFLAVKIHPLDPGLINYKSILKALAKDLKIKNRVFYLESGNLPALLSHTAGVITVNSTVGGSALVHGRPTIALGKAIYNLPGLTFQDGIDHFWTKKSKPDAGLFRNFRDVVVNKSQINGGFYSRAGIDLAVANSIHRLTIRPKELSSEISHIN